MEKGSVTLTFISCPELFCCLREKYTFTSAEKYRSMHFTEKKLLQMSEKVSPLSAHTDTPSVRIKTIREEQLFYKIIRRCGMKGYFTDNGYMGYVDGKYELFVSESEYIEYIGGEAA